MLVGKWYVINIGPTLDPLFESMWVFHIRTDHLKRFLLSRLLSEIVHCDITLEFHAGSLIPLTYHGKIQSHEGDYIIKGSILYNFSALRHPTHSPKVKEQMFTYLEEASMSASLCELTFPPHSGG